MRLLSGEVGGGLGKVTKPRRPSQLQFEGWTKAIAEKEKNARGKGSLVRGTEF